MQAEKHQQGDVRTIMKHVFNSTKPIPHDMFRWVKG